MHKWYNNHGEPPMSLNSHWRKFILNEEMEEKTADWKGEKHVPKITIDDNKVTVDVGISMGTPHPMTEEHYIMWIELICKDNCYKRQMLAPGMEPKAIFMVADTSGLKSREFCNLHGLWTS